MKVKLIIYDRKNAGVADRMAAYGFNPIYIPKSVWTETPEKVVDLLRQNDIDLVVLAGFLRVIPGPHRGLRRANDKPPSITAAGLRRHGNVRP